MIYLFKNTIYTYLRNCPEPLFYTIDKALAPFQQGYFFSTKYKLGQWDGRVHLLHKQFNSFPTGLIDKVCRIIGTSGENFKVVDKQTSPQMKEKNIDSLILKGVELRSYQKKAIQICLEKERGVLDLSTNAGKTEIVIGLMKVLEIPTLLLTHRKELLYQTAKRIQDRIGWKANRIGDGLDEKGQLVTVAMVQSLSKLSPKNLRIKLKDYQLLVCDEVHHGGSATKTYFKVGMCCPARTRIGLSGTPWTKNEVKDLRMVGMLGPTIMRITNANLVKDGYSAKPEIKMLTIDQSKLEGLNYQDAYLRGIVHNSERNKKIFEAAKAVDLSTLIIVQHIEHGRNLESLFKNGNCQFIWGDQDTEIRQQALKDFQAGGVKYLISSVILDEGIDLPTIRHLILGAGGKSSIRTVQRLGRALRLDEGKEKVLITDFMDIGNSYLQSHSRRRRRDYERESFNVTMEN